MIVLELAPSFIAGWLLGKFTSAEWRTWMRMALRRWELGIPLRHERWSHRMRRDVRQKQWR